METTGTIEINVSGLRNNQPLTPDNYDIREIISVLESIDGLLFAGFKKDRPTVSYELKEGSVKHIFRTSMQAVITVSALLTQVHTRQSIDFLESPSAKVIERFQAKADDENLTFQFSTSLDVDPVLVINQATRLHRSAGIWVTAELYLYGIIEDMGGKSKANIHLDTKEYGLLKIAASKNDLSQYADNPLYKRYGVRVMGKQHIETGEIDRNSLQLLELIDYNPGNKTDYIHQLIKRATPHWADVADTDQWLNELRGYEG